MARQSVKINPRGKVFVDTAAFVGILVRRDENHQAAIKIMADLRAKKARLFTTEVVLFELANSLSSVEFRELTISFIDTLRELASVSIISVTSELLENALNLYRERSDKE